MKNISERKNYNLQSKNIGKYAGVFIYAQKQDKKAGELNAPQH